MTMPIVRLIRDVDPSEALTAAPAAQIPYIEPGDYRWSTEGSRLVRMDVEVYAQSPGLVTMESTGFAHDPLPLPLMSTLSAADAQGHYGAVNVGRIDTLTVEGSEVQASGFITVGDGEDDPGRKAAMAIALGNSRGISIDASIHNYRTEAVTDEQGVMIDTRYIVTEWQLTGATLTPFPAVSDALVTIEGVDTEQAFEEGEEEAEDEAEVMDPEDMEPEVVVDEPMAASLVASRTSKAPPASWFADPQLDRPTPLTVEADGRVYGHLAPWDSPASKACHVGFSDRCVCAPPSPDGEYPYMMSGGTVLCADGSKAGVATIAYDTGHPADDGSQPWTTIKAVYDDPSRAALQVALGEDAHGIWFAGRVAPIRTPEEVEIIRACGVSAHWRTGIQGDRKRGARMIGACCVISEGFPKGVLTASADEVALPPVAQGPVAVYEGDELVSLTAANGTAQMAYAKTPASHDDVAALSVRLDEIAAALAASEARLAMLDPQVREAAASALG